MVPVHHIFGSEELSSQSPSVAERSPKPYVSLNPEDADQLNVKENDLMSFEIDGQPYRLPVRINDTITKGIGWLALWPAWIAIC